MHAPFDVCIVGAGLSGLFTARKVLEWRPSSTIAVLEARDRVGGRTLSLQVDSDAVDLGGQWVGPSQHKTLQLLNELKLEAAKQPWFGDGATTGENNFSSGSSVPLTETEEAEMKSVVQRLEGWAATVRDPASWGTCPDADWDSMSVRDWFDHNIHSAAVRREMDLLVRTVTASEPDDLSLFYFLFFLGVCDGVAGVGDGDGGAQTYKIPGGAQQLCLGMAKELSASGVRVQLNAAITSVTTTGSTVSVATASGEVIKSTCLVVAISPPLWSTIKWSPPLSAAKQDVGSRMYMGSAVKTITTYKDPFWQPFEPKGQLEELGPVANLFPSSVSGKPALIGLVTAGAAKTFAALSEDDRRAKVLAQYEQYFGSSKALECVSFISKDWMSEPYSKGCYAALMPPGLATSSGTSARAVEGRVCFAATELATAWPGYFEGALDAGYRAAGEAVAVLGACEIEEQVG